MEGSQFSTQPMFSYQQSVHGKAIAAGNSHTCGVTTSGDAYCWGMNPSGQLGNGELDVADLHGFRLPARMDVRADVVLGRDPAKRRVLAVDLKRRSVHQEEANVALLRRGDIGLGDDVAVPADRLDHLVEVGLVLRIDLEHA